MTKKQKSPLKTLLAASLAVALIGCSEKAEDPMDAGMADASDEPVIEEVVTVDEGNPFFVAWDTPYGIPPFDSIRDEHYKPAFEAGIEELRNDIAVIRDNPEPPTNH